MGVTIRNKETNIDLGSRGFFSLKGTIAGIYSKEVHLLYNKWSSGKLPYKEVRKKLNEMQKNNVFTQDERLVLNFLFAPQKDGKLSVKDCRRLYKRIKNYDDNIAYGYIKSPNCVMFKDFKNLVQNCARNRWILRWQR